MVPAIFGRPLLSAAESALIRVQNGGDTEKCSVMCKDVSVASKKSHNSLVSTAIRLLAPFQALMLVSLASLLSKRDAKAVEMEELHTKATAVANASGLRSLRRAPTWQEVVFTLDVLAEVRLCRSKKVNTIVCVCILVSIS